MRENKAYKFKCGGNELAKVLMHYGLIHDIYTTEQKIMCPFHEDKNPSMIVNLKEGKYFCFGCYKAGNALDFVITANKNKMNDLHALKKYFEILKCKDVEDINVDRIQSTKVKDKAYFKKCWNEAHDYYYGLSRVKWKSSKIEEVIVAREYMKKRGFSADTLNKCKAKVTYNRSYGIVFPMYDNGKFKGWVSRTMDKEIEKKRKYLYNEGFRRKTTLCGDYKKDKGPVYIVEGYMDRLKLMQYGIENVVAILGWKMSDMQIRKLKKEGFTHVISALDNDECGRKGTAYLENFFKVTRFRYLKGIKDPGEMSEEDFCRMNKRTLQNYKKDSQVSA